MDGRSKLAATARVRACCLSLPEATERLSHGSPAWFVGRTPQFATLTDDHHGDGVFGLWCAAPEGAQRMLVEADPNLYFVPPYVGHRGWVGLRLDRDPAWDQVETAIERAYTAVAPRRLVQALHSHWDGP